MHFWIIKRWGSLTSLRFYCKSDETQPSTLFTVKKKSTFIIMFYRNSHISVARLDMLTWFYCLLKDYNLFGPWIF